MSASAPAPPKAAAAPVERPNATTTGGRAPRRVGPIIAMVAGAMVIVGALVFLMIDRGPEVEVVELAAAFACPPGVEPRGGRVKVTATTLNVRAAPSASAERLPDRTLRKNATVAEDCRSAGWSRVRLVDGRSGWVANRYLAPLSQAN